MCGYADTDSASCSRMKPLTMPLARRPLNARVSAVVPGRFKAWRWGSLVPASGESMNAVPIWAAQAPAASTAAMPAPSAMPPEATSGRPVTARVSPQQCQQADLAAAVDVGERAAMAARLHPLDDERVGAGQRCCCGLVGLGDGDPDRDPIALQRAYERGRRAAKRERHKRYPQFAHDFQLGLEVVIVEVRHPGLSAVGGGDRLE